MVIHHYKKSQLSDYLPKLQVNQKPKQIQLNFKLQLHFIKFSFYLLLSPWEWLLQNSRRLIGGLLKKTISKSSLQELSFMIEKHVWIFHLFAWACKEFKFCQNNLRIHINFLRLKLNNYRSLVVQPCLLDEDVDVDTHVDGR